MHKVNKNMCCKIIRSGEISGKAHVRILRNSGKSEEILDSEWIKESAEGHCGVYEIALDTLPSHEFQKVLAAYRLHFKIYQFWDKT